MRVRGDNGGDTAWLVLSSGSGLDIAGELGAVLGPGFEVSLVRAANRQTVELALDGAVQFGIVHILAHGATSVLDFGGERMSEAELVSLIELAEGFAVRRSWPAATGTRRPAGSTTRCTCRWSPTMRRSKIGRRWSLRAAFTGRGGGIGTWIRPWIGGARRWRCCIRVKRRRCG